LHRIHKKALIQSLIEFGTVQLRGNAIKCARLICIKAFQLGDPGKLCLHFHRCDKRFEQPRGKAFEESELISIVSHMLHLPASRIKQASRIQKTIFTLLCS
jgi:hypothetical protein